MFPQHLNSAIHFMNVNKNDLLFNKIREVDYNCLMHPLCLRYDTKDESHECVLKWFGTLN